MNYFEHGDFMDLDDKDNEVDVLHCHECNNDFEVPEGSEPEKCPMCNIEFI